MRCCLNKFREITGIEIDKFALSKFLGKYRKVSGLISSEKEENAFERDLMLIFDDRILIENYMVWERLFEILIVNDRYDLYGELGKKIIDALERYEVPTVKVDGSAVCSHDGLLRFLHSALCRTSAIVRGKQIDRALESIGNRVAEIKERRLYSKEALNDFVSYMRLT